MAEKSRNTPNKPEDQPLVRLGISGGTLRVFAQLLRNICGGAHRLKLCLGKMSDGYPYAFGSR
jgi:hypothetical protein